MSDLIKYVNQEILRKALNLKYTVADLAPQTEIELFNSSSLVIWSGASDNTIYGDCKVNWAFRALHDALHLKTRFNFDVDSEIELGRLQACQFDSDLMRELIFCEVSLQAAHFKKTGHFVNDQVSFTKQHLNLK